MDIRLLLDKISITLAIPRSSHETVRMVLNTWALEEKLISAERYNKLRDRYKSAYMLKFDDVEFCAIQIDPIRPDHRFMRLEWNPSKAERVCKDSMALIIALLNEVALGDGVQLLATAKITRIDFAFDLLRVRVNSFFVNTILRKSVAGQYVQHHEQFAPHGQVNSRYIGQIQSPHYLLVYDKRLEAESRQIATKTKQENRTNTVRALPRLLAPITRFELRLKIGGPWSSLRDLENPFAKYNVVSYQSSVAKRDDHVWSYFIDSCYLNGAQVALSRITDRHERKRYSDTLRQADPPSWWNPESIWAQVPVVVWQTLGIEL